MLCEIQRFFLLCRTNSAPSVHQPDTRAQVSNSDCRRATEMIDKMAAHQSVTQDLNIRDECANKFVPNHLTDAQKYLAAVISEILVLDRVWVNNGIPHPDLG